MHFRRAESRDIPFLAEAIVESEKSGSDHLLWTRVFNRDEPGTLECIISILEEEIEGQEWNPGHFFIAEENGEYAAALSAWIEQESGMASGMIKAQTIGFLFPSQWKAAEPILKQVSAVQIPRIAGALQLENIYVRPAFRGRKLAPALIEFVIHEFAKTHPHLKTCEIQLMGNNDAAIRSYTHCGFLKRTTSAVSDDSILTLLPGTFKVSMQREMHYGS